MTEIKIPNTFERHIPRRWTYYGLPQVRKAKETIGRGRGDGREAI